MNHSVSATLALVVLLSVPAAGQDQKIFEEERQRCQALSDKNDREDCITKATTKQWSRATQTDKLDGSKAVMIGIMSPDKLDTRAGRKEAPFLGIRCLKNKTTLMVLWTEYLGSQPVAVRWRLDSQPIVAERWPSLSDGVIAPNPVDMAKKMLTKTEFVISVEPYDKAASSVSFHLDGLADAIKPVRESCGW